MRDVTARNKKAEFIQQSRRPTKTSGFALSPIRAVFLDSNRWVVEPTVSSNLHLVPSLRCREGGRPVRHAKVTDV
jgi:hypothetical protein